MPSRRTLLTGASSGIGRATAERLARAGDELVLVARDEHALGEVAAVVEEHGARAEVLPADLADPAAASGIVEAAVERLGGLDLLVLDAGAAAFGSFEETPREDFEQTLRVTFHAQADTLRAALPHLERSGGVVVAVGSTVSRMPVPMLGAYTASKHALRGLLGAVRMELRERDSSVRIAMVNPGPVDTPFWGRMTAPAGWLPPVPPLSTTADAVAKAVVAQADRPRAEVTAGTLPARLSPLAWELARPVAEWALVRAVGAARRAGDVPRSPGALWSAAVRR